MKVRNEVIWNLCICRIRIVVCYRFSCDLQTRRLILYPEFNAVVGPLLADRGGIYIETYLSFFTCSCHLRVAHMHSSQRLSQTYLKQTKKVSGQGGLSKTCIRRFSGSCSDHRSCLRCWTSPLES